MRSNSGQAKTCFSCSHHVVVLHYKITAMPKFCNFRKSIAIYHCMSLLLVVLVTISHHTFGRPPCWYYRLQEIKNYEFTVFTSRLMSMTILFKSIVLWFSNRIMRTDRQTCTWIWPSLTRVLFALKVQITLRNELWYLLYKFNVLRLRPESNCRVLG